MKIICNEHIIDRLIRVFVSTVLFGISYFWLSGVIAIVATGFGVVMFVTSLSGWCPLYSVFGINTSLFRKPEHLTVVWVVFVLLYVGLVAGGSYASVLFSSKFFLEDFNEMNNAYKQTLFHTGQGQREVSMADYESLVSTLDSLKSKYAEYRPYTLRGDKQFSTDIETMSVTVNGLRETIATGDLHEAHLALETVRPILQDILKRNGFSLLAVALIDFHDAMELMLAPAETSDAAGVVAAYDEASAKLQVVEKEANDTDVQTIRTNLEELKRLATEGKIEALPKQAAALKSSFVKVYLARG